jgi:hypothetical protein
MSTYFHKECDEGFLVLYGDQKKSAKAFVIGVVYNKKDAALFVDVLQEKGEGVPEYDTDADYEEPEEVVSDLVDELSEGFSFGKGDGFGDEWNR